MKELFTYSLLAELSKKLSIQGNGLSESYATCWQNSGRLIQALKQDMETLFNQRCFIIDTRFILGDPTDRQGASIARLEIKMEQVKGLLLVAECLIDHQRIQVRVKQRPTDSQYESIAQRIEQGYNTGFVTELQSIK